MTSGQRLDTNSQWLAQQLTDLGIEIVQMITVGDQLETMVQTIQQAIQLADLVVCTGGLGPTDDDLTRFAFAKISQTELEIDEPSLQHIKSLFEARGRQMTKNNIVQAMLPSNASVIANKNGTAPGIDMLVPRGDGRDCRLVAFPGVPYEMKDMWCNSVLPGLRKNNSLTTRHYCLHCFGASESELATRLPGLISRDRLPRVGITASQATITFRVSVVGTSEEACKQQAQTTLDQIRGEVGDLIFGSDEDTLESVVANQLANQNLTVAFLDAELAGLPQTLLVQSMPVDSSSIYGMSFSKNDDLVSWHNQSSNTPSAQLESDQFAISLAHQVARNFGADIGVAVFGRLTDINSANMKCNVALWNDKLQEVFRFRHLEHRDIKLIRAAKMVLNQTRLFLTKLAKQVSAA